MLGDEFCQPAMVVDRHKVHGVIGRPTYDEDDRHYEHHRGNAAHPPVARASTLPLRTCAVVRAGRGSATTSPGLTSSTCRRITTAGRATSDHRRLVAFRLARPHICPP